MSSNGGGNSSPSPFKKKKKGSFRKRKAALADVSSVLSQVMNQLGMDRRLKQQALMSCWSHTVGEPFSSLSRPLFIDYEGNLVVSVKDAAVGQELTFRKEQLLSSLYPLARSLGLKLKGLRFDLKHFKEPELEYSVPQPPKAKEPTDDELATIELDEEQRSHLEQFVSELSDKDGTNRDYNQRITRMYERELKLHNWKLANDCPLCSTCQNPVIRLFGAHNQCGACYAERLGSTSVNKVQD